MNTRIMLEGHLAYQINISFQFTLPMAHIECAKKETRALLILILNLASALEIKEIKC